MRGQEPVTGQRAGHVERSRRAVWESPRQSHGEGPRDDRVPGEAGEQGVDDWRSPGSEVPINHKAPKKIQSLSRPQIFTQTAKAFICEGAAGLPVDWLSN